MKLPVKNKAVAPKKADANKKKTPLKADVSSKANLNFQKQIDAIDKRVCSLEFEVNMNSIDEEIRSTKSRNGKLLEIACWSFMLGFTTAVLMYTINRRNY